jgi:sugar phosphate isomerase/epimerase
MNRRDILKGLAVTGLATAAGVSAAPRKLFFERVGLPIGLQLYTLGDEPKKDIDAVFARVVQIGYRDAELPSLYGMTPTAIKAAADRAGLRLSSIHLPGSTFGPQGGLTLLSETSQIAEALGILDIKRAVMPIMTLPANFRPATGESFQAALARALADAGPDIWKKTATLLNERAAALKPLGIALGYHNHNVEFAPVGKTTGWEILSRETDRNLVGFECDIGWLAAAGIDPVAFLKHHSGRIHLLHVKDVRATTKTNFALQMDPTEVGSGKLDWARILPAAYKAGARNFYVEQEPPFAASRMEAAAMSFGYLSKLAA